MYENGGKRCFDCMASLLALCALAPVMLGIAGLVYFNLGCPIFFRQKRPGKNEKIFEILKFRTMANRNGADGKPRPDAERLTKFGRWLRSTSADELPELLNILKGEMSFIGPRPLLVEYLSLYSAEQKKRHDVRPGLSGLAQINGRNALTWEEKFRYDVWYVENISFGLDMKILWRTLGKVWEKEGISAAKSATMEVFRGNGK